jgi:hypothetical protein
VRPRTVSIRDLPYCLFNFLKRNASGQRITLIAPSRACRSCFIKDISSRIHQTGPGCRSDLGGLVHWLMSDFDHGREQN